MPARLQELENEQEAVEAALAIAKATDFLIKPDQIEFLLCQFESPQEGESWQDYKRKIIKCFVSQVVLYDDKLLIYYNVSRDGEAHDRSVVDLDADTLAEVFDQRSSGSTKRKSCDCSKIMGFSLFL
jgi:hypothetical protein